MRLVPWQPGELQAPPQERPRLRSDRAPSPNDEPAASSGRLLRVQLIKEPQRHQYRPRASSRPPAPSLTSTTATSNPPAASAHHRPSVAVSAALSSPTTASAAATSVRTLSLRSALLPRRSATRRLAIPSGGSTTTETSSSTTALAEVSCGDWLASARKASKPR